MQQPLPQSYLPGLVLLTIVCSFAPEATWGRQFEPMQMGPLHGGLAHATLAFPTSVAGPNPAMQHVPGVRTLTLTSARLYNLAALRQNGISINLPAGKAQLSGTVQGLRFGQYRRVRTSLAGSYPFRFGTSRGIQIGIRLSATHAHVGSYGTAKHYALSMGLLTSIWHNLYFGAAVRNLIQLHNAIDRTSMLGAGVAAQTQFPRLWIMGSYFTDFWLAILLCQTWYAGKSAGSQKLSQFALRIYHKPLPMDRRCGYNVGISGDAPGH